MYNATLYFKDQLNKTFAEAFDATDDSEWAALIQKITYLKLAIFALERLEEQDANK